MQRQTVRGEHQVKGSLLKEWSGRSSKREEKTSQYILNGNTNVYVLFNDLFINYTNNQKNSQEHTTYRAGLVKKLKSALASQD